MTSGEAARPGQSGQKIAVRVARVPLPDRLTLSPTLNGGGCS